MNKMIYTMKLYEIVTNLGLPKSLRKHLQPSHHFAVSSSDVDPHGI